MNKKIELRGHKVKCQSCLHELGEFEIGKTDVAFKFRPDKTEFIFQELDVDNLLLTIQCPKCGCMTQVRC